MLCYSRLDVPEGISVSKSSASKKSIFVTIGVFR